MTESRVNLPPNRYEEVIRAAMLKEAREHTELKPVIDELWAGTFESAVPPDMLEELTTMELTLSPEEFQHIWDLLKVERNGLTAILLGEVWGVFQPVREGLVTDAETQVEIGEHLQSEARPAQELGNITEEIFTQAIEMYMSRQEEMPSNDPALNRLFSRYHQIMRFGARNGTTAGDLGPHLLQGVITAKEQIWGLVELLPAVLEKKGVPATPENQQQLLENGYGDFVRRFATLPVEKLTPLLRTLKINGELTQPFDPEHFDISTDDNGELRLTVNHDRMWRATLPNGEPVFGTKMTAETTWCPALYAEGEFKSVFKEYFEWCVELAKKYLWQSASAASSSQVA